MTKPYEAPKLLVHGTVQALTLANSNPIQPGNDPCRYINPAGTDKQTGLTDYLIGTNNPTNQNGDLATCSA